MHVREIHLEAFMSHDNVKVQLPERGIVLVTGLNGRGKSALVIESIATACWGKTLRLTPPWRAEEGLAAIKTPEVHIERRRAGKKPAQLSFARPGERAAKYDTASKAQEALNGIIGEYDVWRRTSVFSSADANHFSVASDKERKLLFEAILGLDRFDTALKRCREEMREVGAKVKTFEAQAAVLKERINGLTDRLKDLDETEASETLVAGTLVPAEKVERMKRLEVELTTRRKQLEVESQNIAREVLQADAEHRTRKAESDRLDRDACPTCGHAIPEAQRRKLRQVTQHACDHAEQLREQVRERRAAISLEIEGLDEEREDVRTLLRKAEATQRDHAQLEKNRAARADKRALLEHQIKENTKEHDKAKERYALMCHEYDELEVCETVLGLKGVRAHMLGDAMGAITSLANAWLKRLFPGVTVLLHEDGDKVALEVKGLGHDYGYRACSSGMRRRIDIALLLALSDLEAASRSTQPGTLILDEVADSLDEEGIPAFGDMLVDLAETRAIVLISHKPELYESLPFAMRLVVEDDGVRMM